MPTTKYCYSKYVSTAARMSSSVRLLCCACILCGRLRGTAANMADQCFILSLCDCQQRSHHVPAALASRSVRAKGVPCNYILARPSASNAMSSV
eukprot:1188-Heterococcus_DN1.PRE.4